ncbi:MAG: DUF1127 domain-containing protein [Pseudomonadota bacterium]
MMHAYCEGSGKENVERQLTERSTSAWPVFAWARRLAAAIAKRRSLSKLRRLDDRALADIGLTRSDVDRALLAPLGHDPTMELEVSRRLRSLGWRPTRNGAQIRRG